MHALPYMVISRVLTGSMRWSAKGLRQRVAAPHTCKRKDTALHLVSPHSSHLTCCACLGLYTEGGENGAGGELTEEASMLLQHHLQQSRSRLSTAGRPRERLSHGRLESCCHYGALSPRWLSGPLGCSLWVHTAGRRGLCEREREREVVTSENVC